MSSAWFKQLRKRQFLYRTRRRRKKKTQKQIIKSDAITPAEKGEKAYAMCQQFLGGPMVHHDTSFGGTVDNTGQVIILSNIAQGTTEHTRTGEETMLLSSRLNLNITDDIAATTPTMVRVILFRSMLDDTPTVGGLTTSVLESSTTYSLIRQDNKKNHIILWDKIYTLNNKIAAEKTGLAVNNIYKSLRKVKASYNGTTNADWTKGHLFILLLSNKGASDEPTVTFRHRIYIKSI